MALTRKRSTSEPTAPPAPMDRDALVELSKSDERVVTVRTIDVAELAGEHPENRVFANLHRAFANASPDRWQQVAPATLRELLGLEPTPREASA